MSLELKPCKISDIPPCGIHHHVRFTILKMLTAFINSGEECAEIIGEYDTNLNCKIANILRNHSIKNITVIRRHNRYFLVRSDDDE